MPPIDPTGIKGVENLYSKTQSGASLNQVYGWGEYDLLSLLIQFLIITV